MTYTPNVPQANQTIAATQTPINNNFMYLNTALQYEHNFNGGTFPSAPTGTHQSCSMPDLGGLPLVAGDITGVYYVNNGFARYFDGTNDWRLNCWQDTFKGSYIPTSTSSFNNIVSVPANSQGIILLISTATKIAGQMGTFITDASNCYAFSTRMKLNGNADDYPVELNNMNSGSLFIQGRAFSSSYQVSYNYKIFYRPS